MAILQTMEFTMKLQLIRYRSGADDTLGLLYIDEKFACFTLEDEKRNIKVHGETRIPAGTYELGIMFSGKRQRNMIEIMNVPGFKYIQIHTGNTDDDTDGCLLIGDGMFRKPNGDGYLQYSRAAYERITPAIFKELQAGNKTVIQIVDWR